MLRFINLDTRQVQALSNVAQAIDNLPATRGDNPVYDFRFVQDNAAVEIDPTTPATFKFGAKLAGDYAGPYLIYTDAVTKTGGSRFTDAVTTFGSATLTSATAGFMASDAGLAITGPGIPAGATILSVQSSTSITLSTNATVTASGVAIAIAGRAATYSFSPSINSLALNDALVNGAIYGTYPVNEAARLALVVPSGTIVRQGVEGGPQSYWLKTATSWSDDVPMRAELALDGELEWTVAGKITSTRRFVFQVSNDVNRGSEGMPMEFVGGFYDAGTNLALAHGNGAFQKATTAGGALTVSGGIFGSRLELWLTATPGADRTLDISGLQRPWDYADTKTLMNGKRHILVMRKDADTWMLTTFVGPY